MIQLARAGDLSSPLTVYFRLSGTAADGTDYTTLAHTRRMPPGKITVELKIRALADAARTGARDVKITLLPGDGYQLGDQITAKVKILNRE